MPGLAASAPKALAEGIDPNLLNIFAGPKAQTADIPRMNEAYTVAQQLARQNQQKGLVGLTEKQNQSIFENTGWFVGPDGKLRFEIPDGGMTQKFPSIDEAFNAKYLESQAHELYQDASPAVLANRAQLLTSPIKIGAGPAGTDMVPMGDVISHPALFAAYPDMAAIPTRGYLSPMRAESGEHFPQGGNERITFEAGSDDGALSVLVHELQHGVQDREGFASGGNPQHTSQMLAQLAPGAEQQLLLPDPYNIYKALTGEVEARAVQSRFENALMAKENSNYLQDVDPDILAAIQGKLTPYAKVPGLPAAESGSYDIPFSLMVDPNTLYKAAMGPKDPSLNQDLDPLMKKLRMLFSALGGAPPRALQEAPDDWFEPR